MHSPHDDVFAPALGHLKQLGWKAPVRFAYIGKGGAVVAGNYERLPHGWLASGCINQGPLSFPINALLTDATGNAAAYVHISSPRRDRAELDIQVVRLGIEDGLPRRGAAKAGSKQSASRIAQAKKLIDEFRQRGRRSLRQC